MKIHVSTMGPLRRLASIDDEAIDVGDGSTVGQGIEIFLAKYPSLAPHRDSLLAAMDEEWVDKDATLTDGCSLILMPPVSGG